MKFKWAYADYSYSSTQVNLTDPAKSKILKWGKQNIPDSALYVAEDNKGRETVPHITILYGITSQNPKAVEKLLVEETSIEATLGKISLFDTSDDFDVVKIDVKSKDLHRLHKLLDENIDNENSFPEYKPHVTIAYVKKGKGSLYAGSDVFEGTKLSFNEIRFSDKKENATMIKLQKSSIAAQLSWRV